MRTVRLPLLRGSLFLIALAAMAFILARGDNPAQATSYNPVSTVSVSDPTPGANADLTVTFSLNAPDAFPNLTREPSVQFLPRQWGINVPETEEEMLARVGAVAGTFDVLTNLGIMGGQPCINPLPLSFTMYDSSVDTTKRTSDLDVDPVLRPGGPGYSGQFMPDLDYAAGPPSDFGTPLVPFVTLGNNQVGNEFHNGANNDRFDPYTLFWEAIYRDNDGSGSTEVPGSGVTVGDTRLTQAGFPGREYYYPAGSVVAAGDAELYSEGQMRFAPMLANEKHTESVAANGLMDVGEGVYADFDNSGDVSYGDMRNFTFEGVPPDTTVTPKTYLPGGITRYPDFLAELFPPEVVGEPLARMWGGQMVITAAVSVNLVTFRPGQLADYGFPASLGYATVTIVLDPVAPPELVQNNLVNVTCTPLALTSTNFGLSHDNPATPLKDEGGYVRLTNPRAEKDHVFTLVTTSDYDADDDGIENWLDTCDVTPNSPAGVDGRHLFGFGAGDNDTGEWRRGDGLNEACDPDPLNVVTNPSNWMVDQDLDSYNNVADNCPLNGNGWGWYQVTYRRGPAPYNFLYALPHDPVGPDNQVDTDGDRIGDACEGSESGGPGAAAADQQCVNATDDDGDEYVNDGCPVNVAGAESGAQCDNAVDDDGDGLVNDGCPQVVGVAESGAQCDNAVDDDGDGVVNEGCPTATGSSESGAQCANAADDDGDGLVNDGCPTVSNAESGAQCANALDDDADGKVNDGCPAVGSRAESATAVTIRQFLHPDSVIASSQWSAWYSKEKAFDGNTNTGWCTSLSDRAPFIEAQFASPQDINSLDLTNPWAGERFNTGRITMSNEFSQDVTLSNRGEGSFTFSTQTGVTWVRFTGLTQNTGDACFGEFELNLSIINVPAECGNDTDDDGDGVVNDGCPLFPSPNYESGAQCANAVDDDTDGVVNDGCPPNGQGPEKSWLGQCSNAVDDDGDGKVNDGCPYGAGGDWPCWNALDDDFDGYVNDGCRAVIKLGTAETICDNSVDDDADGLVNDGCPAVDPGGVAKTTRTGHRHVVSVVNAVPIFKHGIKLSNLGGPDKIKDNGARTYTVDVANLSGSDSENVQVALQVVEGCATVNGAVGENTAEVSVAPGESGSADFTVDFTGCTAGEYTVQADACHGGDAAPAGFFGSGRCPGFAGHGTPQTGVVPLASATASSESNPLAAAGNVIDGNTSDISSWCSATLGVDPNPVLTVYTAYPSDIDSLTLSSQIGYPNWFDTGTITMSNGFSQDVTLTNGAGTFSFPTQAGVSWVRLSNLTRPSNVGVGCFTEVSMNGSWLVAPPDPNPLDDVYMTIDVEVGTP